MGTKRVLEDNLVDETILPLPHIGAKLTGQISDGALQA